MAFRRTFITGLLIVLPVIVTYWLLALIIGAIDASITPVLTEVVRFIGPDEWLQYAWVHYLSPLVSVFLAVAVVYFIGLVGGNVLGRQILRVVEGMLLRIPVVRGIYSAVRQFVDTFSRPEGAAYRGVVLVEFPRPGSWSLGLITGNASNEVTARIGQSLVSVFVPTTPNPTGGYLIFVPEERALRLEMSVDEALKMIISGGVLTPESAPAADATAASGSGSGSGSDSASGSATTSTASGQARPLTT
jgi:uncharacterized membrane protein